MTIRVLLVDDSAVVRGLMNKAISADSSILVNGSAANGLMAINLAKEQQPDVIVLDIEMPVMDGITALPELLKASPRSKIIIASTLSLRNAEISLKALSLGASDYIAKPVSKSGQDATSFFHELIVKIKALVPQQNPSPSHSMNKPVASPAEKKDAQIIVNSSVPLHQVGIKAIAIASSTGGPQALMKLFEDIKGRFSNIPIFITQHMPATFTTILADHLSRTGGRPCSEGKEGEKVNPGSAYVAPGDYHMVAEKTTDGSVVIHTNQNAPENFCRPAADPMLRSLSEIYGKHLAVVVLTGMGQDGMEGSKVVVKNGGHIIAQNEETCVVYGMPKAVVENNLTRAVLPLADIGKYLVSQIEG